MRRSLTILVLVASIVLPSCKAKKMLDAAAISKDLDKRGTTDLLKETSKDQYTPPADGRLTDGQVQMYLKVREHEKDIAKVAKAELQKHSQAADKEGEKSISGMMEGFRALGSAADVLTADIRAAKDLGYNTAEYQWVKGQVLAASTSAMAEKMSQATSAMMDSGYQQMKKQYDEAKDETSKKMFADAMKNYEDQKKQMEAEKEKEDPAVAYNRQLLSKYENVLNAMTTELSKWENKEGEAQQGMKEFQQNLDKAAQDAKTNTSK
jgi:hypothetical protein